MSIGQKISNTKQVLKGRLKEGFGRATGNRRVRTEGRTDRVVGNLKQSGQKAKDAFRR
ncbi:uncharacterized protein YjbJ (UPF0337 family) [Streptacidiphilus sp. MAP12-20]|uniref:CsbD family protein n=1 Tax=Streptacidiphilus sp. MAP12-20 TaxID=3156299 RepID=UPI0035152121